MGNAVQGVFNFNYFRYKQHREEWDSMEDTVAARKKEYVDKLEAAKQKAEGMIETLEGGESLGAEVLRLMQDREDAIKAVQHRQGLFAQQYDDYKPSSREELDRSLGQSFDQWVRTRLRERFKRLRNGQEYARYEEYFSFVSSVQPSWVQVKVASKRITAVNLREQPDIDSKVMSVPTSGTPLLVLSVDKTGTWYFLKESTSSRKGWTSNDNLEIPTDYLSP